MENLKDLRVYKYLTKEHAESMMTEGIIKIGTFFYFRQMEQQSTDTERGDENEGALTKSLSLSKETDIRELPMEFLQNIKLASGVKYTILKKASLKTEATDTYIYCCSKTYSPELMKSFNSDACIEIFDVENFRKAILLKLVEDGYAYDFGSSDECKYDGHEVGMDFKETGHFLKDEKYVHQEEYRFLYQPIIKDSRGKVIQPIIESKAGYSTFKFPESINLPLPNIKPVLLKCKEATKFCRIL